jgi:outer membrane protein assembly factor BamB
MSDSTPLLRQWLLLRMLSARRHGVTLKEMATDMRQDLLERVPAQAVLPAGGPLTEFTGQHFTPHVLPELHVDSHSSRLLRMRTRSGLTPRSSQLAELHGCAPSLSTAATLAPRRHFQPPSTPVVADGKVYTLGAEGHLFCLEAETGKVVWSHDFQQEYGIETAVWGFSSNPLLDGQRLICMAGGDGTAVLAFDKDTGKEIWRALSTRGGHGPGYGSPIIAEAGGRRQLIIWHTEAVSSLDPETGGVFWEQPFRIQNGQTVPTPRQHGEQLFVTGFYDGSLMLRLDRDRPAASVAWQRKGQSERNTDALHSVICTPFLEDGHIYGSTACAATSASVNVS